jgi:hypothetical protein
MATGFGTSDSFGSRRKPFRMLLLGVSAALNFALAAWLVRFSPPRPALPQRDTQAVASSETNSLRAPPNETNPGLDTAGALGVYSRPTVPGTT